MNRKKKIIRTWKGWASLENTTIYENMLVNEAFPEVKKKGVEGLEKVSISTMEKKDEMEVFLVLQFDSLESVKMFAVEEYNMAYIPDNGNARSRHWDRNNCSSKTYTLTYDTRRHPN